VGGNGGRAGIAVVIVFAWVWGVALGGMVGTVSRSRERFFDAFLERRGVGEGGMGGMGE